MRPPRTTPAYKLASKKGQSPRTTTLELAQQDAVGKMRRPTRTSRAAHTLPHVRDLPDICAC
eukprot:8525356-Lingulodinium_polyedra.AAC.1